MMQTAHFTSASTYLVFPNEIVLTCHVKHEQLSSCSESMKLTSKSEFYPETCRENNHFLIVWISICLVCGYSVRKHASRYFEATVMVILDCCSLHRELKGEQNIFLIATACFYVARLGFITVGLTPCQQLCGAINLLITVPLRNIATNLLYCAKFSVSSISDMRSEGLNGDRGGSPINCFGKNNIMAGRATVSFANGCSQLSQTLTIYIEIDQPMFSTCSLCKLKVPPKTSSLLLVQILDKETENWLISMKHRDQALPWRVPGRAGRCQ